MTAQSNYPLPADFDGDDGALGRATRLYWQRFNEAAEQPTDTAALQPISASAN